MAGFFKIYRGWADSAAFRSGPYCERAAWVWLIEKAAWKDCTRRDPHGNMINVQRGQLHTSTRVLGAVWGWSKNKVSRFLRDLKKCQMLDHQTDQHGVLLTICNYEKYQGEWDGGGPLEGPESDQGRTTQEEVKERKEDNKGKLAVRPDDVSEDVWGDFLIHRKAKKAPVTKTAFKGIQSQADKAGWPIEGALAEIVTRGWVGFKAEWVEKKGMTEIEKLMENFVT